MNDHASVHHQKTRPRGRNVDSATQHVPTKVAPCHPWNQNCAHLAWFMAYVYLAGGAITILKNMSSSMGRMTSHILWKIRFMFETTNQLYVLFTDMWAIFGGKWGERSHLSICHTWNGRCANTELVILGSRNPPSFRPSHFETEPRLVENTAREHLRLKTLRLSGRIDASQRNLDLDKVLLLIRAA